VEMYKGKKGLQVTLHNPSKPFGVLEPPHLSHMRQATLR